MQTATGPTASRKKHRSRRNSQANLTANDVTAGGQKNYNELERIDAEKCKNVQEKSSEIVRGR